MRRGPGPEATSVTRKLVNIKRLVIFAPGRSDEPICAGLATRRRLRVGADSSEAAVQALSVASTGPDTSNQGRNR